jgi:hypothetical protein
MIHIVTSIPTCSGKKAESSIDNLPRFQHEWFSRVEKSESKMVTEHFRLGFESTLLKILKIPRFNFFNNDTYCDLDSNMNGSLELKSLNRKW